MAFRIKRSSLIWLSIAAAMFFLSFVFTAMVTWVGHEEDSFAGNDEPKHWQGQLISVFRITPRGDEPYITSFVANPHGGVDTVEISVYAEDSPVILLNNVVNPKSCFIVDPQGGADQKRRKSDDSLTVKAYRSELTDQRIYRLTPHFGSLDQGIYAIRCKIRSTVKYDTFTDRSVELTHYNPFQVGGPVCARPLAPNAPDCDRDLLDGLEPRMMSKFIDLNFSRMKGADNLHYSGGYEDQRAEGREYDRGLGNGRRMFVMWEDIYRQQLRDTLLIVIGTLIGIGVTVLIEGIRPYLEALGEKEGGPPKPDISSGTPPQPKQKIEIPPFRPAP